MDLTSRAINNYITGCQCSKLQTFDTEYASENGRAYLHVIAYNYE